jgi:hypothetical protein
MKMQMNGVPTLSTEIVAAFSRSLATHPYKKQSFGAVHLRGQEFMHSNNNLLQPRPESRRIRQLLKDIC